MKQVLFIILSLLLALDVQASDPPARKTISVIGRKDSFVTKKSVSLSDIAKVRSARSSDDEAVIALKKITITSAPRPGKSETVSAARILERLREEGVNLNSIGYSFPRILKITRASRQITVQELEAAIQDQIDREELDMALKKVEYQEPVHVIPGVTSLDVELRRTNHKGKVSAVVTARVKDEAPVRFHVNAQIEEWAEVPVAGRALYKGAIVQEQDLVMARLKTTEIPADTAISSKHIVGFETSRPIRYGEVFRKNKLAIPPLVKNGEKVLIQYKSRFLEATATGVALEDGIEGQKIRIRNENSRKVVAATVIEPGLVGVNR